MLDVNSTFWWLCIKKIINPRTTIQRSNRIPVPPNLWKQDKYAFRMDCLSEGRGLEQVTQVLSSRICQFHKTKCGMVGGDWGHYWAGKRTGIWFLISLTSELRMSDSWPLSTRSLALLREGQSCGLHRFYRAQPHFPGSPQRKNIAVFCPWENWGSWNLSMGRLLLYLSWSFSWNLSVLLRVFCFASLPP